MVRAIAMPEEEAKEAPVQRTLCTKVRSCLKQQVPLFMVLLMMGLAALSPSFGTRVYKELKTALVVLLFVFTGFVIRSGDLAKGAAAIHVHCGIQLFSLIFTPFLYYFAVYRWHWASASGMLSEEFDAGIMAAMLMPTTTTTNVLWTQLAGGDVSIAAVNSVVGNMLGCMLAPLLASVLLNGAAQKQDLGKTMLKMSMQIIVPFIAGMVAQFILRRFSQRIYERLVPVAKHTLELIMCVMLYGMFSGAFRDGADGLSFVTVLVMLLWVTFLHLVFLTLAWVFSWPLRMDRRVAVVFTASEKTENMAIAILGQIFGANAGVYALPIVAYHSVQMIIAAMICAPLLERVKKEQAEAEQKAELQSALQQQAAARGTLLCAQPADASKATDLV